MVFTGEPEQEVDRQVLLTRNMLLWRLRLDPAALPDALRHGRGRNNHVSQEEVAALTGVSVKWYGALERGELHRNYSDEFLNRVADVLRLSHAERSVLFLLVKRREPPPHSRQGTRRPVPPTVTAALRAWIAGQRWPAFVCDASWEILAANSVTDRWFSGLRAEGNLMRWLFCCPSVPAQFDDWPTVAKLMFDQLTAQAARRPDDEGVREVLRAVMVASKHAKAWWLYEPGVWLYDDGNCWRLHAPGASEPVLVEIISASPLRDASLRIYTAVPLCGQSPAVADHADEVQPR